MGYLEIHHCERQKFKKNSSSATHCCRRLAASGHDDFSLHSAKLDSLSSHLQLGRPGRRRGFVTKFSFQSSSGLQETAKIGHLLVLEANDVASRNCLKYQRSVQSCIGWSSIVGTNLSFIRRMLARQSSALLRARPANDWSAPYGFKFKKPHQNDDRRKIRRPSWLCVRWKCGDRCNYIPSNDKHVFPNEKTRRARDASRLVARIVSSFWPLQ